ncbi:MAG: hypothetical protein LBD82_00105 [Deltaproteobacteria bacterium]|nr:hypothetical protein [Deltaproteobacteria bacterium]
MSGIIKTDRVTLLLFAVLLWGASTVVAASQEAASAAIQESAAQRQAGIKAAAEALRSFTPPLPAVLPDKSDWPLPVKPEDPAWFTPEINALYTAVFQEETFRRLYPLCLEEACRGNPLAMLILVRAYASLGEAAGGVFTPLNPSVHRAEYWLAHAEDIAGSAWVARRLGDLAREDDEKTAYYAEAARLGDAEAMYVMYFLTGRPELLIRAAQAGHAQAAAWTAACLSAGRGYFPSSPRVAAAYWWRAALAGDAQAMLACSEFFGGGLHGFPKDAARARLFALMAVEKIKEDAVRRISLSFPPALSVPLAGDAPTGAELLQTAESRLKSLMEYARLTEEQIWELRQEMEIFKAAPQEELRLRLKLQARERARSETDMARELRLTRLVLDEVRPDASSGDLSFDDEDMRLLLDRLAQRMERGAESSGMTEYEGERARFKSMFSLLGLAGAITFILIRLLPPSRLLERLDRLSSGLSALIWICTAAAVLILGMSAAGQAAQPTHEFRGSAAEERSKREAVLIKAVKSAYMPPPPGVIPPYEQIPLPQAWEDPEWDTPLVRDIYKNPYSYGNNLDNYLPCLYESMQGNPKAMLALSMLYYLWEYILADMYPDFPPTMHNGEYWRNWAEKIAGPAWVRLQLGHLHRRWPAQSLEYYRQAAELGNAEAMFQYYSLSGENKHYLYRSAAMGYARAAFTLGEELELLGGTENINLARRFTWISALNGDEWGLLRSSIAFYNNEFGNEFNNCEMGHLYSQLAQHYKQSSIRQDPPMDNACLLSPVKADVLEAQVKQWQAWQEDRHMPEVSLHRRLRAPMLAELRAELSTLERPLRERMAADTSDRNSLKRDPAGASLSAGLNLPWHLGFYSDGASGDTPSNIHSNQPQARVWSASEQFMGMSRREGMAVSLAAAAFTALALVLLGAGRWREGRVKAGPGQDGAFLPPLLRTFWAKRSQGRG